MNLLYLISIPLIRSGDIVCQRLWTCKFVIGRWGCDDIAVTGDLAGEAGDGAGNSTRNHINRNDSIALGIARSGSTLIDF